MQTLFDGITYEQKIDGVRLCAQASRVFRLMRDGQWRTLREIADATGDPEASISARLRDFRKERWGRFEVERRRRGETPGGTYEYRLGA